VMAGLLGTIAPFCLAQRLTYDFGGS